MTQEENEIIRLLGLIHLEGLKANKMGLEMMEITKKMMGLSER